MLWDYHLNSVENLIYYAATCIVSFSLLGFQRGTHPAKIPLKARQRSESRNKETNKRQVKKYRDERLDWLRNRDDGGSLKTRGCLFLFCPFLLDKQKIVCLKKT
jgi:hypothetical protein